MPDAFSQGLQGVLGAASTMQGIQSAKAQNRRANERAEREREAHEFTMGELRSQKEQDLLVAESGATARVDSARRKLGVEEQDQLAPFAKFNQEFAGTENRVAAERISASLLESEGPEGAASVLNRIYEKAKMFRDPAQQKQFLDNSLIALSRRDVQREFASLQQRYGSMSENGAFAPVQMVGATEGQGQPDTSGEEAAQTFERIQMALDGAASQQDYDFARGMIRTTQDAMMKRAKNYADRRTEQAQRQGFSERNMTVGQTLMAQGFTGEAMQYFALAHSAPFLPMDQIAGAAAKVAEGQAENGLRLSAEGSAELGSTQEGPQPTHQERAAAEMARRKAERESKDASLAAKSNEASRESDLLSQFGGSTNLTDKRAARAAASTQEGQAAIKSEVDSRRQARHSELGEAMTEQLAEIGFQGDVSKGPGNASLALVTAFKKYKDASPNERDDIKKLLDALDAAGMSEIRSDHRKRGRKRELSKGVADMSLTNFVKAYTPFKTLTALMEAVEAEQN